MNSSTLAAGCDDAAFGPIIHGCRQDFDFTLAFEQYFFSVAPSAVLLLTAPIRIALLRRQPAKVTGAGLRLTKVVCLDSYIRHLIVAHSKDLFPRRHHCHEAERSLTIVHDAPVRLRSVGMSPAGSPRLVRLSATCTRVSPYNPCRRRRFTCCKPRSRTSFAYRARSVP